MAAPDRATPSGKRERPSLSGPAGCLSVALSIVIVVTVVWVWVALLKATHLSLFGALLALISLVVMIGMVYGGWAILLYLPLALYDPIQRLLEASRGGPPWYRNPSDIEGYPEEWREAAAEMHNRIADVFDAELDTLTKLGIPPPKLAAEPVFSLSPNPTTLGQGDYIPETLRVVFPRYILPKHFFYKLLEANSVFERRSLGLLVGPENKTIESAEQHFAEDPNRAFRSYSGGWFNRSPYQLFEVGNSFETGTTSPKNPAEVVDRALRDIRPRDPIETATGLSPEEFDHILWRLSFFGYLVADTGLPFDGDPPAPAWLSDGVVQRIPLPGSLQDRARVTLKILPSAKSRPSVTAQFLDSLRSLQAGFAFEIVAEKGAVWLQFTVSKDEQAALVNQLAVHLPEAVIVDSIQPISAGKMRSVQVGLVHAHLPMKSLGEFAVDSHATLLRLLDELPPDQSFCLQVLASPLRSEALSMVCGELETLRGDESLAETVHERSLHQRAAALAKKSPPWLATLRMYSTQHGFLTTVCGQWLGVFASGEQKVGVAKPADADGLVYAHDAYSLLNTDELAGFVHLPGAEVESERLERSTGTMKAPPALMTGQGSVIGINEFRGQKNTIAIPDAVRDRHLYIIGKTRTGKSTLMLNLAVQDIRAGKGIGVIDPHGDLIEDLLRYIPQERVQDTVYWDASERTRPIGLNIMEVHTDEEVGLVADDLLVTFRRLSDSWGERMESLLRYIFHTLLHCEGTTFFDVQNILVNEKRRLELVSQLEDPMLIQFWQDQVKLYGRDAIQPILSRMSKFVLTPAVNAALGQRNSSLNFFEVLQNQKILLVNLASGKVGEDSAKLLGSLVVSQIQLAAMRRAKVRREARAPFYLYVDEFQNFTTSSFDKILSEAGKYKLCLALAHQYISQLDDKIRNAILGNAGTLLMFPSSAQDAQCLRAELGTFTVDDLTDLSAQDHEALCRPPTKSSDTFKLRTLPPPERPAASHAQQVIEHSRAAYGRPPEAQHVRPREAKVEQPRTPPPQPPPPAKVPAPPRPAPQQPVPQAPPVTSQKPAASTEAPRVKDVPLVLGPTSQGRGGMAHKQLQYLIRNFGQKFGYQATIEKQILGGAGSVDVALEKGELSIACQVCVTTGADYEVKSIHKCLEAGFSAIVLISDSRKTLNKARDLLASAVPPVAENRVRFLALEDLAAFLVELEAAGASKVETIRGRKVSVTYKALSPEEQELRKQAINEVVAGSLLRLGRMQPE